MTDRWTPEEILRQNPQIDRDELNEARETLRRLREQGSHRKDYDLIPPFGGRRVIVLDDARIDPRPMRTRRPRGTD